MTTPAAFNQLVITGMPSPESWTLTLTGDRDSSGLSVTFVDDSAGTAPPWRFNNKPNWTYGTAVGPAGGGTLTLEAVATDEVRSAAHRDGIFRVYRADYAIGDYTPGNQSIDLAEHLRDVIPGKTGISPLSTFGNWMQLLSPAGTTVADLEMAEALLREMNSALADRMRLDDAIQELATEWQILVPDGDWTRLVCTLDAPASTTALTELIRYEYQTYNISVDAMGNLAQTVRVPYLVPGAVADTPPVIRYHPPLAVADYTVEQVRTSLEQARLSLALQTERLRAPFRRASATVPLPLTASEIAALVPGSGVEIGGVAYWVASLSAESNSHEATLDLIQAGDGVEKVYTP